jgi:uncharacterized protein
MVWEGSSSGTGDVDPDAAFLLCRRAAMTDSATSPLPHPPGGALRRLIEALSQDASTRSPAPVDRWNPDYCGDIDMHIAADGTWFYNGSPISRPALVRLFASVLRKDPERYVLVTPVERLGITVEDVPFLAVEMAVEGEGDERQMAFRTNVDDIVRVGPNNPVRFELDRSGGVRPYVRVRSNLWARLTRSLAFDLLALAETRAVDGREVVGVGAGDVFFVIAPLVPESAA